MPHMQFTFQEFNETLIQTIRYATSQIDSFDEGAIAVRYIAKSPSIAGWLGEHNVGAIGKPGGVEQDPNVDLDLVYSVIPGGPKTRTPGWRGDPNHREIACAGYAALKLEGCAYAVVHGYGRCSDDMPAKFNTDGRINSRGSICFDLYPPEDENGIITNDQLAEDEHPWLRLYVAVSGATGPEDKWCAYQSINALQQLLCTADPNCIVAPDYEPNFDEITMRKIEN